jgi:hypothetical protein
MKKLTVLLFSILISFNSYGEWVKFDEDNDATWYIDYDAIKKNNGYIYYWELQSNFKPLGHGVQSFQIYHQGDCRVHRFKDLTFTEYKQAMGRGESTNHPPGRDEWVYPRPGSFYGEMLEAACKRTK